MSIKIKRLNVDDPFLAQAYVCRLGTLGRHNPVKSSMSLTSIVKVKLLAFHRSVVTSKGSDVEPDILILPEITPSSDSE